MIDREKARKIVKKHARALEKMPDVKQLLDDLLLEDAQPSTALQLHQPSVAIAEFVSEKEQPVTALERVTTQALERNAEASERQAEAMEKLTSVIQALALSKTGM